VEKKLLVASGAGQVARPDTLNGEAGFLRGSDSALDSFFVQHPLAHDPALADRKSTRLNSSHW
jgi:hypothetical protein